MKKGLAAGLIVLAMGFGLVVGGASSFIVTQVIFGGPSEDCKVAVVEAREANEVFYSGTEAIIDEDITGMSSALDEMEDLTNRWERDYDADDIQVLLDRCHDPS